MSPVHHVIIVAGGTGSRVKSDLPKQFIPVHDKPIIVHTIEKFLAFDPECHIVIAAHPDHVDTWEKIKLRFFPQKSIYTVLGGSVRFESVKNALETLPDKGVVAVHDAVRPCVAPGDIARSFQSAREKNAAVLVVPLKESVREISSGDHSEARDRDRYVIVQTPQTFSLPLLKSAYKQEYKAHFTDDASVVESIGVTVHMLEGSHRNIKITTPDDLKVAKVFLSSKNQTGGIS